MKTQNLTAVLLGLTLPMWVGTADAARKAGITLDQAVENIYAAAAAEDTDTLEDYSESGYNLNLTNSRGDSAVCLAVNRNNHKAYDTLLGAGAEKNPACLALIPPSRLNYFWTGRETSPQRGIFSLSTGGTLTIAAAMGTAIALSFDSGGSDSSSDSSDSSDETTEESLSDAEEAVALAVLKPAAAATNDSHGAGLLPNFAQENLNVFRSLSSLITDTMYAQEPTDERLLVGYDFLAQGRSGKGALTGYDNMAHSGYILADKAFGAAARAGVGVAVTQLASDYDDDSSRDETFVQALGSYMYKLGEKWTYAGVARLGYGFGDYARRTENASYKADLHDFIYGANNELRYRYELPYFTLEPQVELNVSGYYQRHFQEKNRPQRLTAEGTNNLSVEGGVGLYAGKEVVLSEHSRIKGRVGGSYYREFAQPYHTLRVADADGYYLLKSDDIFERNRGILRADVTFSRKALEFYLRATSFVESKHTAMVNVGLKYNF